MTNVLILHDQPVGRLMAGPSARYWEFASTLSRTFNVTLAVPEAFDVAADSFRLEVCQPFDSESLERLARGADAIVVSWLLLSNFPVLGKLGRPLVVDIYIPSPMEDLELYRGRPMGEQLSIIDSDFSRLRSALGCGDFFICGTERQRDFWLGLLGGLGRLNPLTYQGDPAFRRLIDVVSMGIPEDAPVAGKGIKGEMPGILAEDFLVVWPGGLWDWLDPLTAVEAFQIAAAKAGNVKLLFPGRLHPQPDAIGGMQNPDAVLRKVTELGLLGRQVFFSDWTPYGERSRYLLGSDVALSLHLDCAETRFAVRVRLLDCLWAGTPVVATRGDVIAEAMAERGLAKLVPPRDPDAVAEAILSWRETPDIRRRLTPVFREMADEYRWSVVTRPLLSFLKQPYRAGDLPPITPRQRWQSDSTLSLPFDVYHHCREVAEIIEALRSERGEDFSVLASGDDCQHLHPFLAPRDSVVKADQCGAGSTDLTAPSMGSGSFDFVVHLSDHRHPVDILGSSLRHSLSLATQGVVLIVPTMEAQVLTAEAQFLDAKRGEAASQGALFPDREAIEKLLDQLGNPYYIEPTGPIHRWLAISVLRSYVSGLADADSLRREFDRYCNKHFGDHDRRAPSAWLLIFIAQFGDNEKVERVRKATGSTPDFPPSTREDFRYLGQLSLLMASVAIRAADEIADDELACCKDRVRTRDDELQRISRRKMAILMRKIDSFSNLLRGLRH